MGKLRRKAKSPASGSTYNGIALPREKARWVWKGLARPAVAEVRMFWTRFKRYQVVCNQCWEGYFENVIGYRLQVTLFKM